MLKVSDIIQSLRCSNIYSARFSKLPRNRITRFNCICVQKALCLVLCPLHQKQREAPKRSQISYHHYTVCTADRIKCDVSQYAIPKIRNYQTANSLGGRCVSIKILRRELETGMRSWWHVRVSMTTKPSIIVYARICHCVIFNVFIVHPR
jgi:hypothetical protein